MMTRQTLNGAYNGLATKVRFIKDCYHKSLTDQRVRSFAEVAGGAGPRASQARGVFAQVREKVKYMRDPVGMEFTKSPSVMLDEIAMRGYTVGDCDDQACFMHTLLNSIGIPTKLRVTWYGKVPMPQHIYVVSLLDGKWVPIDTTRAEGFGQEVPYARKQDF
jgi:transglutaminase-like putative cysteine protease